MFVYIYQLIANNVLINSAYGMFSSDLSSQRRFSFLSSPKVI